MPKIAGKRGQSNIQTVSTPPNTLKEKADKFYEKYFRKLGFEQVVSPVDKMPTMPVKLAAQSDVELSNLTASYQAWKEYSQDLLAYASLTVAMLTEEYESLRKRAFIAAKGSVTEKKLLAEATETVIAKSNELATAMMYKELLEGKIDSFTGCLATLSREVSLRKRD